VCNKKVQRGSRGRGGRAPGQGVRGTAPTEAETFLAFRHSMEAASFILGNTKSHRCLCWLAIMTFNKSHLGMCMVTRGHFKYITIKFFLGWLLGGGQGHGAAALLYATLAK